MKGILTDMFTDKLVLVACATFHASLGVMFISYTHEESLQSVLTFLKHPLGFDVFSAKKKMGYHWRL